MIPKIHKLFHDSCSDTTESVGILLEGKNFTLEHIISRGDASAPNFWYEQDNDEWVALIVGSSTLEFPDGHLKLTAGDAILIPAKLKHRVAETSSDAVWIALHFKS
jgi:cupin 2 domain-containing protein